VVVRGKTVEMGTSAEDTVDVAGIIEVVGGRAIVVGGAVAVDEDVVDGGAVVICGAAVSGGTVGGSSTTPGWLGRALNSGQFASAIPTLEDRKSKIISFSCIHEAPRTVPALGPSFSKE